MEHRRGREERNSSAVNLEKFMDPLRPFKCEVCKESFTQKNILMVHNNSVSHLNKAKKLLVNGVEFAGISASSQPNVDLIGSSSDALGVLSKTPTSLPNASPASISDSNFTNGIDRKPYKCNICKVAYSQGSTLDIHLRSVAHSNKSGKLPELVSKGEIDFNLPLIETPELPKQPTISEMLMKNNKPVPTSKPNSTQSMPKSVQNSPANQAMLDAQKQMAAFMASLWPFGTGNFMMPSTGGGAMPGNIFTCDQCQAIFTAKDQLDAHGQNGCWNRKNAANFAASNFPAEQPQMIAGGNKRGGGAGGGGGGGGGGGASHHSQQLSHTPGIFHKLLENYGFEMVMQYNEARRRKRPPMKLEQSSSAAEAEAEAESEESEEKKVIKLNEKKIFVSNFQNFRSKLNPKKCSKMDPRKFRNSANAFVANAEKNFQAFGS